MVSIWPINTKRITGEVEVGGCSVTAIAQNYGTPIFVLDEGDFKARIANWQSEFKAAFNENAGEIFYAAKSFISVEIAKIINQSGIGLDVCTGGELAVARAAKFPGERIEMHGNNKSEKEIEATIDYRVGVIVLDSLQEIERVARIAHGKNRVQKVVIRLNPGVEAHTHEYIATAHEDVKFGFSIASGSAADAIDKCMNESNLELSGIHCHIGSQIFEVEGFITAAKRLIEVLASFKKKFGKELAELNIGGGYGIAYTPKEVAISPELVIPAVAKIIKSECQRLNISVPKISIEPGRAIVGPTTTTIYEVGTTKDVTLDDGSTRKYISVDGGMSDNIRPALYGATYSAFLANRSSIANAVKSRVVGKHCESGDILISNIEFPEDVKPGDLLAIPATGAYGRSMASNYNHIPRPAVVTVQKGSAKLILRRETEQDLLNLDVDQAPRRLS